MYEIRMSSFFKKHRLKVKILRCSFNITDTYKFGFEMFNKRFFQKHYFFKTHSRKNTNFEGKKRNKARKGMADTKRSFELNQTKHHLCQHLNYIAIKNSKPRG